MALLQAEKLLTAARDKGQKLTTKDRRHVVGFLMATDPSVTNTQMAEWFGVAERTIRLDKLVIRQEKAKILKEDDIGLVIADILMFTERAIREIETDKKKAKQGSQVKLNYIKAQHEIQIKTVQALQELGYYPKNLGSMTVEKYEYKAIVNKKDGSVDVRPVDWGETLDAEFSEIEPKQLSAVNDEPRIPAPVDDYGADGSEPSEEASSDASVAGTAPETI